MSSEFGGVFENHRMCLPFIVLLLINVGISSPIDEYVELKGPLLAPLGQYEPLYYDLRNVISQQTRYRRDITNDSSTPLEINVQFQAYGRPFNLNLHPDESHISKSLQSGMFSAILKDLLFDGTDEYDPGSYCYGSIIEGQFIGRVQTADNNSFTINPSKNYFNTEQPFHSIMTRSAEDDYPESIPFCNVSLNDWNIPVELGGYFNEETLNQLNQNEDIPSDENEGFFGDNVVDIRYDSVDLKVCRLSIIIDYTFYEAYRSDPARVVARLSEYIKSLNLFYNGVIFSSSVRDIQFVIADLKIYTSKNEYGNPFSGSSSPNHLLYLMTSIDFIDYCMGILFTFRDFNGILGAAPVGKVAPIPIGPCKSKRAPSYNIALITEQAFGKWISSDRPLGTLAHEIGHNFGSQHDTEYSKDCHGSTEQRYLMYPKSNERPTSPEEWQFSACSLSAIDAVLKSKRSQCFHDSFNSCGNLIVDSGEDCDCGSQQSCEQLGVDTCCVPPGNPSECTHNTPCSNLDGPCCINCDIVAANTSTVCVEDTECTHKSYCNGLNATCPTGTYKANGTLCNSGTQYCNDVGQCTGSICDLSNMTLCDCPETYDFEKITHSCVVCCQNETGVCATTSDWGVQSQGSLMLKPTGSQCGEGTCDYFGWCVDVADDKDFFGQFWKKFVDFDTWSKNKWWLYVLIFLLLVAVSFLVVTLGGARVVSSNPFIKHITVMTSLKLRQLIGRTDDDGQVSDTDDADEDKLSHEGLWVQLFRM